MDYVDVRRKLLDQRAMDLALTGQVFISADELKVASIIDDIQMLNDNLREIGRRSDSIYYTFIYTQRDNELVLLADVGDNTPFKPDLTQNEQYRLPITDGLPLVMEPYTDSTGSWSGVLVPITDDETGKTAAVLGIQYSAFEWSSGLTTKVLDIGMIVLPSQLVMIAIYLLFRKNRVLASVSSKLRQREAVFMTLIESMPMGIAIWKSGKTDTVTVNNGFGDILGIGQEALSDMTIDELMKLEDGQPSTQDEEKHEQENSKSYSITKKIDRSDGKSVWVNMCVVSVRQSVNKYYLCIIEDVTQRILTETALRESERSKAVLLAHLPGMAYRCMNDREWTMLFVSEGCEKLTGYSAENLLYNKDVSFNGLIQPKYREELWQEWERVLALNLPFCGEYEILAKDGSRKWVMEMGQGIYDEEGNTVALEGIIIDMTSQKMGEDQIRHMSNHDFLTSLYNRRFFEQEKKRMQDDGCVPVSIIVANINGVRLINDAFGHMEGDHVIVKAASIMKRRCREGDVLARTGGDEFSLLLPNTDAREANDIIQSIYKACEQYNNMIPARRYDISLTLGVATKMLPGDGIDKAAKEAEESMHSRKLLNRKSSHSLVLSSIMATMFERSRETEEHAMRLSRISKAIGEKLNLPQKSLDELELFSMLHDIGKVGIDDRILNKPGKLNDKEWAAMRKHPEIGYRIAMSSPELEPIAEYILYHHERWDGKGYPQGLKGDQIPLLSRILAVADAYDAMMEDRVYRKAMTKQEALEEIGKNAGTQFDPIVSMEFIESMK